MTMLIIAGHLIVAPEERDRFVEGCQSVVEAARRAPGCADFAITADSVDPGQVRVYELWESEADLLAFRGSGPSDGQQAAIRSADVRRFSIASVGEP